MRVALVGLLVIFVGIGSLYAYRAQGPDSPQFVGIVVALLLICIAVFVGTLRESRA